MEFVGELTVQPSNGSAPAQRRLHDPDCGKVASGLAFTAAIALGQSRPLAAKTSNSDLSTRAEAPSVTPAPAPTRDAPPATTVSSPDMILSGSSFGQDDEISVDAGTLRFVEVRNYTAGAGVALGVLPDRAMPRYSLRMSLADFLALPDGQSRLLGTMTEVEFAVLGPTTTEHGDALSLDTLGFEVALNNCAAFRYNLKGWVSKICGEYGLGILSVDTASPDSVRRVESQQLGYGFAGILLGAQYNFASWAHLGVEVGGRLQTSIDPRDTSGVPIYETATSNLHAAATFGVHF